MPEDNKMISFLLLLLAALGTAQVQSEDDYEVGLEFPNLNETNLEDRVEPSYRFSPVMLNDKLFAVNVFTKVNWFTAQQICSYQGMTLASIRSSEENEELRSYLRETELTRQRDTFWVSGTDLAAKREWFWMSNGLPLAYTNWRSGEPNDAGGNERCITINGDGQWNDLNCHHDAFFICENRCQLDSYSVPLYPPF